MRFLLIALLVTSTQLSALKVAIISALPGEVGGLKEQMIEEKSPGGRSFYTGELHGVETVITHCWVGKVAAAFTTTELIARHHPDIILFIGVAGAADPSLNVGDVVIAHSLVQHDIDCRPFIPRHIVPFVGVEAFSSPPSLTALALEATNRFFATERPGPHATLGLIATGDKVFADKTELAELRARLPDVACVEMEGAAVDQVAHQYGIPLVVIRTISDVADESAHIDIRRFVKETAGLYAEGIVRELFHLLQNSDHSTAA